jgi:hypothetical protein
MPPLSTQNRFAILTVDNIPEVDESSENQDVQTNKVFEKPALVRPRWEKSFPAHFVVDALDETEGHRRSLTLKAELQATDTGEIKSVQALLDSGATGMFIDTEYVKASRFSTRTLSYPIPVRNVDGTLNEAGSVREVVELVLRHKIIPRKPSSP